MSKYCNAGIIWDGVSGTTPERPAIRVAPITIGNELWVMRPDGDYDIITVE